MGFNVVLSKAIQTRITDLPYFILIQGIYYIYHD